jgi:hypothetical protein
MALLSKKEFAEGVCGITTKDLAVYIGRKQVVVTTDDLIDTTNDKNKAFAEKCLVNKEKKKGAVPAAEPPKVKKVQEAVSAAVTSDSDDEEDEEGIPSLIASERKLKHLDTQKREEEIQILKLKKDKLRGLVIPTELVKPLLKRNNQEILNSFKALFFDDFVRKVGKRHGLTVDEIAELKRDGIATINKAMTDAKNNSVKNVDNIIDEFSEKKGKGERE